MPRHRQIGIRIPIRVKDRKFYISVALAGEIHGAAHIVFRYHCRSGAAQRGFQGWIAGRIKTTAMFIGRFVFTGAFLAGRHDRFQVFCGNAGAGDKCRHLLLFQHLPVDVVLDIGVIGVNHDHLRRAPGRPARFDGARSSVANF